MLSTADSLRGSKMMGGCLPPAAFFCAPPPPPCSPRTRLGSRWLLSVSSLAALNHFSTLV